VTLCYGNSNTKIVLASKPKHVELLFQIVGIEFENESYKLFLDEDAWIDLQTRLFITSSSLVQIE